MDLADKLDTFTRLVPLLDEASAADTDDITRDAKLRDLAIDSLSMIELVVKIEDEFKVRLDENIVQNWNTVSDVIAYIDEHGEKAKLTK
ncbi:acyl carrier protein [Corynebacterium sp.]|uniref:acyl carrier protein n=1 Tax=Corynebacterium sp. TaxID=1720 RepID=UPI0027BAD443|nr:phosphopantetheine-binding protein [Corynebacterium sp.]